MTNKKVSKADISKAAAEPAAVISATPPEIDLSILSLSQRISGLRSEIRAIAHDKTIDGQYSVTTHEAIRAVLRPLMVRYGLIDWVSLESYEVVDTGVVRGTAKRSLMQYRGTYTYTITNIDRLHTEACISFKVSGFGDDAGDKGPGKSSTYALKTAQKVIFLIGVKGEDGEEDRIEDQAVSTVPVSPEQVNEILFKADEYYGDDAKDVLKRMYEGAFAGFNVKAVQDIPKELYQQALNLLKNQAVRDGRIEADEREPGTDDDL